MRVTSNFTGMKFFATFAVGMVCGLIWGTGRGLLTLKVMGPRIGSLNKKLIRDYMAERNILL